MLSGCATRGYVRDTVGTSEESLSARINENEGDVTEARENIDSLNQRTQQQAQQIQQNNTRLEETRTELTETLTETREVATNALETAENATGRAEEAVRMFGDRNRLEVQSSHEVYFGFDSAELPAEQTTELQEIGETISRDPDAIVILEGYTDEAGETDYNLRLAERRVDAVRRYLVTELQVPVYRIHEFSYGEAKMLHEGEREKNRAVNIVVMGPASGGTVAESSSAAPE